MFFRRAVLTCAIAFSVVYSVSNVAVAGFLVFRESFETPVVDSYQNTNGNWLNFGINTPGKVGAEASRGLSFVGDSGLTWNVDVGNIDIVDTSEWNASDGVQSVDLFGWEAGSMYTSIDLLPGTYEIAFKYARYPVDLGPVSFDVFVDGVSVPGTPISVTQSVQTGWLSYSKTFQLGGAGAALRQVRFSSLGGVYGATIDDVSLVALSTVPEPMSLTAWVIGLGCFSAFAKRSRK